MKELLSSQEFAAAISTASFKTLGCRLNHAEMDALAMRLADRGVTIRPFGEPVDLTVINTCTVTNDADKDSRYAIRQAIRKSPKGRIVVTGCYAQMSPEAVRAIEGVDLVLDNAEKNHLIAYLGGWVAREEVSDDPERGRQNLFEVTGPNRTRANLKIQDGCDYHCSFCIIPFARGHAQSLNFGNIVKEAEDLVARGIKEIVLTGVNIGTYYSEENGRPRRFVDLVNRLQETEGLARLRISSIEPNTVTDSLLKLMSRSKVVCPHLHIPIQSASDAILAAMRRKYRRNRLERLMDKIRNAMPEAGIGTDVIVGFPGETEKEFEETHRFIETEGFSYLHVFPFSTRNGTAAEKLREPVPSEEIHRRAGILRELDERLQANFKNRFHGCTLSVLFEEPEADLQVGYTPNYLRVRVTSKRDLRGEIREVKFGLSGGEFSFFH